MNELRERGFSCHHLCPHNPFTPPGPRAGDTGPARQAAGAAVQTAGKQRREQDKAILENAVEPNADTRGVQREPINLPSPGRFEGLWCFVWTSVTQILNPLPCCEKRFADLKYWAWDSEGSSRGRSQEGWELGRPGEGESQPGRPPGGPSCFSPARGTGTRTSRNRRAGWAFWRGD